MNSAKIADGSIIGADLNAMGAAPNEVLKWNGAAWAPAADDNSGAHTGSPGTVFFADNATGAPTSSGQLFWDIPNNRLGIGLSNPQEKLHVSGNILASGNINGNVITAQGDLVTVSGSIFKGAADQHPDYVFQKYFLGNSILKETYNFQTLALIEAFVKEFHHLPGIKSAEEVKKDGVWDIGASNIQNLEKIEELFLHAIEQEKKIMQLKSENEVLSKTLETLKSDIDLIKKLLLNKEKSN